MSAVRHERTASHGLKPLDRFLQRWRIRLALREVPPGARVCDIGSYDGALFAAATGRISSGVALDPELQPLQRAAMPVIPVCGRFPEDLPDPRPFDVITALAVLEHIPPAALADLLVAVREHLVPNGLFIVTTPMPAVDHILTVLLRLGLVNGQALEQHYGFDPRTLPDLLGAAGFSLDRSVRFQLGLNRLFVFRKR